MRAWAGMTLQTHSSEPWMIPWILAFGCTCCLMSEIALYAITAASCALTPSHGARKRTMYTVSLLSPLRVPGSQVSPPAAWALSNRLRGQHPVHNWHLAGNSLVPVEIHNAFANSQHRCKTCERCRMSHETYLRHQDRFSTADFSGEHC